MADQPKLRAADEDRERVVDSLSGHAAAGRLTLAELEVRVEQALSAKTHAELDTLTKDLPATPAPQKYRRPPTKWLVSIMGGSDKRGRWRIGEKLRVISVMGGCDLDLRGAELEGDEIDIVVVAVMAGCDIYVPDSVEVDVSGGAIMGGNDLRGSPRQPRPGAPVVRIRAYSCFAGVDVWRLPSNVSGGLKKARAAARELERGH